MHHRLEFHEILCEILGTRHVYFQPPENVRMEYPAIKYSRNDIENTFAENSVYKQDHEYEVVVIDKDPDSEIITAVSKLPMCRFVRHYEADGLNHDVFTIYYK